MATTKPLVTESLLMLEIAIFCTVYVRPTLLVAFSLD